MESNMMNSNDDDGNNIQIASRSGTPSSSSTSANTIPLAQLTPETASLPNARISVTVALLFPYSPSTQTLRLVLAEEDPRLRAKKGQLRVSFHGPAARELAKKNPQIGDMLVLELEGSKWFKLKNVKGGREVEWSVRFEGYLKGEVRGEVVEVDEDLEEKVDSEVKASPNGLSAPEPGGVRVASPAWSEGSQREWKIPPVGISKRRGYDEADHEKYAGSIFDDEEELLKEMEKQEEEEKGGKGEPARKKARFSMGTYRLIQDDEDSPSVEPSSIPSDYQPSYSPEVSNQDALQLPPKVKIEDEDKMDETFDSQNSMPPPPLPFSSAFRGEGERQQVPDSPDLKPVDSSGLPLVSPLENRGLNFSDYMMGSNSSTATELPDAQSSSSDLAGSFILDDGGNSWRVSFDTDVAGLGPAGANRDDREDSTGPNSLFDSHSPSPDPEASRVGHASRGRSPVQPSPLRNVETPLSLMRRGSITQSEGKAPLLLPQMSPEVQDSDKSSNDVSSDTVLQSDEVNELSRENATSRVEQNAEAAKGEDYIVLSTTHSKSNTSSFSASTEGFKSGLTTALSDFPPLSHLAWGHTQDFIGVVCRKKPIERAKRGQRDYFMSMRVADSSRPLGITVSVFRPHRDALPRVEVGDCILLRNFKIISQERNLEAVSTDTSAYVFWRGYGREKPPVVNGPPVEWGDEEEEYVANLGEWFEGLDEAVKEDLGKWVEMSKRREKRKRKDMQR